MINLIINLLLKKGWMLFSNLFISILMFYFTGSEAWSIVVIFFSLNMLGLILGVGIKSKTSLSENNNDIALNYCAMLVINIITIFGMFVFYWVKDINNYSILFFSIIVVILSNVNSFYQGCFLYFEEVQKSTDILVKANIFKLFVFIFVFVFYRKVYLFFMLQFLEQFYIYLKSIRKIPKISFDFKGTLYKLKELFYISFGSIPFMFVSSILQIDVAKSMSATSAGYFGLFVQLMNSIRSVFIFIITNFQKKMLSYKRYFKKTLLFCSVCLVSLMGLLVMDIFFDESIQAKGYLFILLVNTTYLITLFVANIQNIFRLNKISFNSSLIFLFLFFGGKVFGILTAVGVTFLVAIYMISMFLRAIMVSNAFFKLSKG